MIFNRLMQLGGELMNANEKFLFATHDMGPLVNGEDEAFGHLI